MKTGITLDQLPSFAATLASQLQAGDVLALSGPLAAGKTTLTAELLAVMGYTGRVTSPTFVLERRYPTDWHGIKQVIHLDFYRLTAEQLDSFDWQDWLGSPDTLTIIEWPDIAAERLPRAAKLVTIEPIDEQTRRFTLAKNFSA
jgi:tRNA threonylcarbamoyladenosine biosynthesis protein TsaE